MHVLNVFERMCRPVMSCAVLPLLFSWTSPAYSEDLTASQTLCSSSIDAFNTQFTTLNGMTANGDIPEDSGLLVHTIHGPGSGRTELNLKALTALKKTLGAKTAMTTTCGDFMEQTPPVFLPWCGSNANSQTNALSDASSWTYIRQDTLINATAKRPVNEVVCEADNNKRYGLIFNNAYINKADNLGCMYPLDGDTGHRKKRGCGPSQSTSIITTDAQGACPIAEDATSYIQDFNTLLHDAGGAYRSYAGSLICALHKSKFDVWLNVRKTINLHYTTWPLNEFVLWNWDEYSTEDLAEQNVVTGIYYTTVCVAPTKDGTRAQAQAIANLYEDWSGVTLPVVNLSNSEMAAKSDTPFSCN